MLIMEMIPFPDDDYILAGRSCGKGIARSRLRSGDRSRPREGLRTHAPPWYLCSQSVVWADRHIVLNANVKLFPLEERD
jgi:hypothetical protein